MSQPVLYVLPEDHYNQQDQARSEALKDLASLGAINVLLEGVYFHDTETRSENQYGIEAEIPYKIAGLLVKHRKRVRDIPTVDKIGKSAWAEELIKAKEATRGDLEKMAERLPKPKLSEGKNARFEVDYYIDEHPFGETGRLVYEKHVLYKRNHKFAGNITQIVQMVLKDPKKPRVFALSIGANHLYSDSEDIKYAGQFATRRDLPTILGNNIDGGKESVEVKYGNWTVVEIAKKALELSDNLPWLDRWIIQLRLKLYISTGY